MRIPRKFMRGTRPGMEAKITVRGAAPARSLLAARVNALRANVRHIAGLG